MIFKSSILFFSVCLSHFLMAQNNDLLTEIDTAKAAEVYQPSFKALQIVTGQSTKMPAKKDFLIDIAHRFGDVSE